MIVGAIGPVHTLMLSRRIISTSGSSHSIAACALGGMVLLAMAVALSSRSVFLWNWAWNSDRVLQTFVFLYMAAGIIYLLVIGHLQHMMLGRLGIASILLIGLLMRLVLLPSAPVLETDSFRYMWDGALVARGMSPYLHTPEEGRTALADDQGNPQLRATAREAGSYLDSINHPNVTTIYPPVAQAAFLTAYRVNPWSGTAWRAVLLIGDVATAVLLLVLLHRLRLPKIWIAIYWWNPIVVKEFYSAGHMDAIVLPLVIGALWLAVKNRTAAAALCLAAAVAAKFWPVILLPLILRSTFRQPRRAAAALGAFALTAIVLLAPMLMAGRNGIAGALLYSRSWQTNDGLFQVIVLLWQYMLPLVGLPTLAAQVAARLTVVTLLVAWLLWLARRPLNDPLELCEACLLAVAGLFVLSPTQFPWYYTWMVPLLALRPRWSLLLYAALLPLYHLHYREPKWVWVEHVPFWGLLTCEYIWPRLRFGRGEPYAQEKLSNYEQSPIPTPV